MGQIGLSLQRMPIISVDFFYLLPHLYPMEAILLLYTYTIERESEVLLIEEEFIGNCSG